MTRQHVYLSVQWSFFVKGGLPPVKGPSGHVGCPEFHPSFVATLGTSQGELDQGGWRCEVGVMSYPTCKPIAIDIDWTGLPDPTGPIELRDDSQTLMVDLPPKP